MKRRKIDGVTLEVIDRGGGEPVVFVHGSMGDECFAVLEEQALTDQYRLIHYHRRGYGNSECPEMPVSISRQSADCRALMQELGIDRAHFVGQSYGGIILLQIARDAPEMVQTLSLLEPALPSVLFSSPSFGELVARVSPLYESGDKSGAVNTFGEGVAGVNYRARFDETLPTGYLERWAEDADTVFQSDTPAMGSWEFTEEDAGKITKPVLNMVGANSAPFFWEIHETIQKWLPHAEKFVVPDSSHAMLQLNPKVVAERLVNFFVSHPIPKAVEGE